MINPSSFLSRALLADAAFSGVSAVGLTLGAGSTGTVGNTVGGVMLTGATALRQSTNYNEQLRDGDYLAIAAALTSPQTPTGYVTSPLGTNLSGRLVRNGCDRIATSGPTFARPDSTSM